MPTVGSIEYKVVTGTVVGIAAFNTAVEVAINLGYAPLPDGPTTNGVNIELVMFKGAAESFIATYPITTGVEGHAGYENVVVAPATLGSFVTALAASTYDFDVRIDGDPTQQLSITTAGGETYNAIAALMSAQVVGGTVAYSSLLSAFVVTSSTTGDASYVTVAAGTFGSVGGDLFAALALADTVTFTFSAPVRGDTLSSFTITGDQILDFNPGYKFTVANSTGNDGVYTVKSSVTADRTVAYPITAVVTGLGGSFRIAGVHTREFLVGSTFVITGSTNNNAIWTVAAINDDTVNTTITVTETVGAVADGSITSIASTIVYVNEDVPAAVTDGDIVAYAASVGP